MKPHVLILGATGATGYEILKQASQAGYPISVLARDSSKVEKLAREFPSVRGIVGDVLEPQSLRPALQNVSAVLSSLGNGRDLGPSQLLSQGTAHVLAIMRECGVKRFLAVSSSAVVHSPDETEEFRTQGRALLKYVIEDQIRMEAVIRASDLDWTIVRPPQLTLEPLTGKYRKSSQGIVEKGHRVSRADVAHFLLGELESGAHLRQVVAIAQ
jgi:uncharacterized protein YbjT (DUF2867 family)